jgi:hypothetical protein
MNSNNPPGSQVWSEADFDGNGDVNFDDYQILSAYYPLPSLALLEIRGDYNNDYKVDSVDAALFEDFYELQYGTSADEADFTGNNIVNEDDFDAFYDWLGRDITLSVST